MSDPNVNRPQDWEWVKREVIASYLASPEFEKALAEALHQSGVTGCKGWAADHGHVDDTQRVLAAWRALE